MAILTSILLVAIVVKLLLLLLFILVELVFCAAPFGPRGGILSSTLDFFETVSVLALDGDT